MARAYPPSFFDSCRRQRAGRAATLVVSALVMDAGWLGAATAEPAREAAPLFETQVRPLLAEQCFTCHSHNAPKVQGGLTLDSREGLLRGGDSGIPAIVSGQPDKSLLMAALRNQNPDLRKSHKQRLSPDQIAVVAQWIGQGAPWPAGEQAGAARTSVSEKDRTFWSFQSVRRPALPTVKSASRVRTPVDRFMFAKLEEKRIKPSAEADKAVLIRRLYFDLIGLPPTPEEVRAFVSDKNPQAFDRLVDRLLASPHYGERWGRHWLDVAGFAESSLFIGDIVRPDFWRYRDYVIQAFNKDKPYDQFVREQLAGDELVNWRAADQFTPDMIEKLVATGFLRCTPDATDNQPITQMDKRYATQQAVMEVSMKALMGLTVQCVRCHSHKYNPIPQQDYYKLIAIFQPAYDPEKWIGGIHDPKLAVGPLRAIPLLDRQGREEHERRFVSLQEERGKLRQEEKYGVFNRWRNRYLQEHASEIEDAATRERAVALLAQDSTAPAEKDESFLNELAVRLNVTEELLRKTYPEFTKEIQRTKAQLKTVTEKGTKLPPVIWGLWDVSADPTPTRLLRRGDFESPDNEVQPGVLSVLETSHNSFHLPPAPPNDQTTGRRLALANWLTHPEHPLTARVLVNRVWQYHFGTGLVATPDDFGARGSRPTHPELLDWLAAEFVESGWSIKHLHRLILLSATWRQSSQDDPAKREVDPADKLLWKFPKRRLEAEIIRDAMLSVSGLLDGRLFGESVETKKQPDGQYAVPADHPDRCRRSVYLSTQRTQVPSFLAVFDAPAMDANWPKRSASAVAQQALALMNNPFTLECMDHFAKRVMDREGSTGERIAFAVKLAYGRAPGREELALLRDFLQHKPGASAPDAEAGAWRRLCQALLSSNEFIYVD